MIPNGGNVMTELGMDLKDLSSAYSIKCLFVVSVIARQA